MSRTLITLAIILSIKNGYCQKIITETSNYRATYNFQYQKDSTDVNSKQNETMVLLIGGNYSLFESYNKKYNDSINNEIAENNSDVSVAITKSLAMRKKSRFNFKILKSNFKTLVFDSYFSDKFIYEDIEELNWKITKEKRIINEYNCVLAQVTFAGRNYNAWFTNEIPINDGPYKFKGLPGFIVKIEDDQRQYVFELESFQKSSEVFDFDTDQGAKVSKRDFFKSYNLFKKSFVAQLSQRGIELDESNSRETQKRVQKSRNNELEISY